MSTALTGMFLTMPVLAQELVTPTVATAHLRPLSQIAKKMLPPMDMVAIQRQDEQDFMDGLAPRYAVPQPCNITPATDGTWEALDKTTSVWRLVIECPNALHINLGFTRYVMTPHGKLFLYNTDLSNVIRAFTAEDNQPHGELWTPPVGGSQIVVELTIPNDEKNNLQLTLGSINTGYRRFGPYGASGGGVDSGSCNVDVACPEGSPFAAQIPAVGVISTGGSRFCTGFLVNNTAQDRTPFFMTANHCGITSGNAASLISFWNYQNSFCRPIGSGQSGSAGNGTLTQFSSGATFLASFSTSDFTLVRFNTQPNPAWQLSYAGWDRSGANPTAQQASFPSNSAGACIHHPNTDEKRISYYGGTGSTHPAHGSSWGCSNFPGPGDNTHVKVYWTPGLGVTEGGSSGSPLFDGNKRVIGQLHGGNSVCGATGENLSDCYGRFSRSWTGGGTNSTRLSNWLDPLGTGATTLDTLTGVAPANDNCVNATLVGNGVTPFTNVNATTDGPNETTQCNFNGYTNIGNDVWYKYQAECTGTATVSLCGANFDTKMAAYVNCPSGPGQSLACNDDFCGTASQISFPVTQFQIYRIRIGGFNGATGSGNMTITCAAAPPPCPADINHDNQVNVSDLLAVINSWGACAGCAADVNHDNQINVSDLLAVINGWGPCPP